MKLSNPQKELLIRMPTVGTLGVVDYYKPAIKLVDAGLAYWAKTCQLGLTIDGIKAQQELNHDRPANPI